MCIVHKIAWVLVLVGALNWGLVGILQFNLVGAIFGMWPMVMRVIYALVGVSAIAMLFTDSCKQCMMMDGKKMKK